MPPFELFQALANHDAAWAFSTEVGAFKKSSCSHFRPSREQAAPHATLRGRSAGGAALVEQIELSTRSTVT